MNITKLSLNYPISCSGEPESSEWAEQIYYHLYLDQQNPSTNQRQLNKVYLQLKNICLQELNDTERFILFHIIGGMQQSQLADQLQMSKYTINRTYHRALQKVRRYGQYLEPFLR